MKRKFPQLPILLLFTSLLVPGLFLSAYKLTSNKTIEPASPITAYYAGPQNGVFSALNFHQMSLTSDPSKAQVIILNGVIPDNPAIPARLMEGAGLVLILGPGITSDRLAFLFGAPITWSVAHDSVSLVAYEGSQHELLDQVVWNSAPQVRNRAELTSTIEGLHPLVITFDSNETVLGSFLLGDSRSYLLTVFMDDTNRQFQEWAYFNYTVYYLAVSAAGYEPLPFHAYPGSPVPHDAERKVLLSLMSGAVILSFTAFVLVRGYSRNHPELLESLVGNRALYESHQAHTRWEEVGFHRPLGGFMFALMLGLILFIPIIIYQNLVLPVYILPSAQALGIWGRVVQFFNFLWLFLDMGTSSAFIKFFSQHRVQDPRKAIQFGQVYIWWQALSGAIQVALVVILASTVLPESTYALYSWSIIIHTMIQIPGFLQVMRHSMMAWQRFDYAQMLDLGLALVFPILAQPVMVSLMVWWGKNHPIFGPAMGGLLGMGIAAYAAEAMSFVLGFFLYRRVGYRARLLFLAHFDWDTVKTAFRYGVFEMLGSFAWAIGQAAEVLITQARLVNYTEIWGNWGLAQNFIFSFNVLQTLYGNLMPSISEAISNAHRKLSQYYSVMAYKWGGLISAFVAAVLLAVADRFILGASGPEFQRAAVYAIPLIIWGAIQYPSWVGDEVQLASNRPYLKASLVFGEQVVRIILAWLLIQRLQINALILAYFIGLLTKGITAYLINHRKCFPQRFYFWQSLAAPFLAGSAHYSILRWFTGLIWQGDQVTSVLIFLIGILLSYPLFVFFYGLFGGWDDETLEELQRSVELSNFMRPLARLFWASTAFGARISPLHGRFPIDIRKDALLEAELLTNDRVSL